jgi:hypothetical protein
VRTRISILATTRRGNAPIALRLLDCVGEEPVDEIERAWLEEAARGLAEIVRGDVTPVARPDTRKRIFAR